MSEVKTRGGLMLPTQREVEFIFEAEVVAVGCDIIDADLRMVASGMKPDEWREIKAGDRVVCVRMGVRPLESFGLIALEYGALIAVLDPEDEVLRENARRINLGEDRLPTDVS